jgi:hypothetical protein
MKIAPLKVSDPWFGRIVNNETVQADSLAGVPIESTVEMELVELLHGGPEDNYRPYLHLRGELTEARPVVELPYGVTELAFRRGGGLPLDAFYGFNQRQLSDLVSKGYFTEAFKVPSEMSGIPWTLPGKADFLVVAPELSDQPPLVFMNVHDQSELELDETNSGYELAAYFPDYTAEAEQQATASAVVEGPERSGSGLDMFSDVSFDEHRPDDLVGHPRGADDLAPVPTGVFDRLVSEIEAKQFVQPEPVVEVEQEAIVPGSAEELYLSRVSPGVEQVLSGEPTEATAEAEGVLAEAPADLEYEDDEQQGSAAAGFLDLSEPEPELTPLRSQGFEVTADEHREAAERRAARIRADLTPDEGADTNDEVEPGR